MPEREERKDLRMPAEDPWAVGAEIDSGLTGAPGDEWAFRAASGVLCVAGFLFGWFWRVKFAGVGGGVGGDVHR
jgi:hypothetical protein